MDTAKQEPVQIDGEDESSYLDIQAAVGITKHMGGYVATDQLHALCRLQDAKEVLEIGCGIGIGPAYIAKRFDCQVVAVDISEKMLEWARRRARREGVEDRITFRKADINELPFGDDRFDAVIAESVLAFVADKQGGIREMIRVTTPGGYVGINEAYWILDPPAETQARSISIGTEMASEVEWRKIWEATGLQDRSIHAYRIDSKREVSDRIGWLGWRSILPAWGRMIKLMLTKPRMRDAMKSQLDSPTDMFNYLGYAIFVGRKPQK